MGRSTPKRRSYLTFALVVSGLIFGLVLAGCGTVDEPTSTLLLSSSIEACPDAPLIDDAETVFVLDWDGGVSSLSPGRTLDGFFYSSLSVSDTPVSSTDSDAVYRKAVLNRVREMLCALSPMNIAVINGSVAEYPDATKVIITGEAPPYGGNHIGQSEFDPCNQYGDDEAVIWGGTLVDKIDTATFQQWVNVIANVTTHEIGHTLGFAHPSEDVLSRMLPTPSQEVMRATTTISDLLGEQEFLISQQTCPGDSEQSYSLIVED